MLRLFSQITMWLLLFMTIWLAGLGWFVKQIPAQTTQQPLPAADAIILLTGASGRLDKAMQLLAEGKGKALFISGAGKEVSAADLLRRVPDATRHAIAARFGAGAPITLGHEAENTIGNARESAEWVRAGSYHSILLVTSSYHMPRSLNEFHEYLPPEITIIPAPVFPDDFSLENGMPDAKHRALLMSEYHKYIASLLRHAFLSFSQ